MSKKKKNRKAYEDCVRSAEILPGYDPSYDDIDDPLYNGSMSEEQTTNTDADDPSECYEDDNENNPHAYNEPPLITIKVGTQLMQSHFPEDFLAGKQDYDLTVDQKLFLIYDEKGILEQERAKYMSLREQALMPIVDAQIVQNASQTIQFVKEQYESAEESVDWKDIKNRFLYLAAQLQQSVEPSISHVFPILSTEFLGDVLYKLQDSKIVSEVNVDRVEGKYKKSGFLCGFCG